MFNYWDSPRWRIIQRAMAVSLFASFKHSLLLMPTVISRAFSRAILSIMEFTSFQVMSGCGFSAREVFSAFSSCEDGKPATAFQLRTGRRYNPTGTRQRKILFCVCFEECRCEAANGGNGRESFALTKGHAENRLA